MPAKKVRNILTSRTRAWRLGCPFIRSSGFRVPARVKLRDRAIDLSLPDEQGVRVSFLELLVADAYGLRTRRRSDVRTVVDIGANVGLFCLATRDVFPSATIHAYEPNPRLKPHLATHARQAGATYFLEAVTAKGGPIRLDFTPGESVSTTAEHDPAGSIPSASFAEVVNRAGGRVDVLKVDCEGGEWELFDEREPWTAVRYVAMEYHDRNGRGLDAASSAIRGLGFTIQHVAPGPGYGLIHAAR